MFFSNSCSFSTLSDDSILCLKRESPSTFRLATHCFETEWDPDLDIVHECVADGANILFHSTGSDPILHSLIKEGRVEAVRECLKTPLAIDFRAVDMGGLTPLHCVCVKKLKDETSVELLRACIQRLRLHRAGDTVDWKQLDHFGEDFFALASENQKLSVAWNCIQQEIRDGGEDAALPDLSEPLPLRLRVWESDWNALGPENQQHFSIGTAQVMRMSPATARLCKMLWASNLEENTEELCECVKSGADIFFKTPDMAVPFLYTLLEQQKTSAVLACLSAPAPLELASPAKIGGKQWTILDYLCDPSTPPRVAARILQALVDHSVHYLDDRLDWSGEASSDPPVDFISRAAAFNRLSLFWPIICSVPHYMLLHRPIRLTKVWQWDLEALKKESHNFIVSATGTPSIVHADRQTALLYELMWQSEPDPEEVATAVDAGANVCFSDPTIPVGARRGIPLHSFLSRGMVKCATSCLQTKRRIDFSLKDSEGFTPSYCVLRAAKSQVPQSSENAVEELLHAVLDRLDQRKPMMIRHKPRRGSNSDSGDEHVDWGDQVIVCLPYDNEGKALNFLSYAAQMRCLSTVWRILRDRKVPYFRPFFHPGSATYSITVPVSVVDWDQLSAEDRKSFDLVEGLQ